MNPKPKDVPLILTEEKQHIFTFEKLEQEIVFWFIVLAIQKWKNAIFRQWQTLMPGYERWGVDINTETFGWRCFSFYLTPPPSFCSTPRPFSSYSALLSQKESLSFMMLASTAPPRNTKCLRLGGSSMRILNFYTSEEQREEWALKHSVQMYILLSLLTSLVIIIIIIQLKVTYRRTLDLHFFFYDKTSLGAI